MERYDLPTGGIKVIIGESESSAQLEDVSATAEPPSRGRSARPQIKKRRPLRYLMTRALILVGAFALVGNIPVYSKINPLTIDTGEHFALETLNTENNIQILEENDTAVTDDTVALSLPTEKSIETYAGHEHEVDTLPAANGGKWELRHISDGETLENILSPLKLATTTESLLINPEVKKELSNLRADRKILIQINNRKVKQLIYATGKRKAYIVSFQDGGYSGKWDEELFEEQHNRVAFTIRNPFHYDAAKSGLPKSVSRQLVKIFKKDVNFRRIKPGDQVSVIFEDYYYQSDRIFTNKVLAAEFKHRGEVHQRIRFTMTNDKAVYLKPNDDLEIKQTAFNRRPIRGGRLSSGFGMRFHPVLRKRRMHAGTDFAAPRGTPIYATGDGRVRFVGRRGGYGKSIELRHGFGVTTRYGHMSRHKKGLRRGDKVKRGDIIGYVGSTGRSTGNHVHYEFRVNGKPRNPMRVKLPQKGLLTKKEMKDFKRLSKNMSYQLIKLRATASIERNVRRQYGG